MNAQHAEPSPAGRHAQDLLQRLKPFGVWASAATPQALAVAATLGGTPRQFYDRFRASLARCANDLR